MTLDDQVAELEDEIERLEAENFRLGAEIVRFKTLTSQLSYRVSSLQDECNLLRADNRRLQALVADYENSICWETTCTNCAKLLNDNYDQYCEIERLRAAREHAEQGIDKMLTEVKRLRAALQLIVDQLEEGFPKSAQQFAMDALGEHLKEARRER